MPEGPLVKSRVRPLNCDGLTGDLGVSGEKGKYLRGEMKSRKKERRKKRQKNGQKCGFPDLFGDDDRSGGDRQGGGKKGGGSELVDWGKISKGSLKKGSKREMEESSMGEARSNPKSSACTNRVEPLRHILPSLDTRKSKEKK